MSIVALSLGGSLPSVCREGAITFGNFDGVHRGHLALLAETVRQARAVNGPAVAVTFDPHPLQILRPQAFQPVLTTVDQRANLLAQNGADHVVILKTDRALLDLSPVAFYNEVIVGQFHTRAIIEGFNFGFGKDRAGSIETLRQLAQPASMKVTQVPALEIDGTPVSSSRVRQELLAGHVDRARVLLGRPFRLTGIVGTGKKRGQGLGFPTANLDNLQTIIPSHGVYAAMVSLGAKVHSAAVNIGPNPTFGENAVKVEVHLLDFRGDLYSQTLQVDLLQKLRDIRQFAGVEELKTQLNKDIARTREICDGEPAA